MGFSLRRGAKGDYVMTPEIASSMAREAGYSSLMTSNSKSNPGFGEAPQSPLGVDVPISRRPGARAVVLKTSVD
jgi:hypothetical protein